MNQFKTTFLFLLFLTSVSVKAQDSEIYVHTAADSTLTLNTSRIYNERLDNNVDIYPVFTPNFNPGGGPGISQLNHIGIYYSGGNWKLYDEDKLAFVKNSSYNILLPGIETRSYAHTSNEANSTNNYTTIDHPKFNGNPNVKLFVSHMYNPGGGKGTYHPHNVGVFYSLITKKWAIYNEDLEDMQTGISFHVVFVEENSTLETMEHVVDVDNSHISVIDHEGLNGNPNAKLIVSHRWEKSEVSSYNDHPIAVYYNGSNWAIYNGDKEVLKKDLKFDILIINEESTASNKQIMEIPSLKIGPNPVVQGQALNISFFNEFDEELTVKLVDLQGKVVKEQKLSSSSVVVEEIATVGLTQGVYMLQVQGVRTRATRRIIIQ